MAAPTHDAPTITLTLRELAEREQAAFRAGAHRFYNQREIPYGAYEVLYRVISMAPTEYPVPKVTRLREVEFDGLRYRSNTATDELEFYVHLQREWVAVPRAVSYAQMVQDLTNRPTEEVDA